MHAKPDLRVEFEPVDHFSGSVIFAVIFLGGLVGSEPASDKAIPLHKSRFSSRSLLIAVLAVSISVSWIVRPAITGSKFVDAINSGDYQSANGLCLGPTLYPTDFDMNRVSNTATLCGWSWSDIALGRRRINMKEQMDLGKYGIGTGYRGFVASATGVREEEYSP